jgi:hypothetical protein
MSYRLRLEQTDGGSPARRFECCGRSGEPSADDEQVDTSGFDRAVPRRHVPDNSRAREWMFGQLSSLAPAKAVDFRILPAEAVERSTIG